MRTLDVGGRKVRTCSGRDGGLIGRRDGQIVCVRGVFTARRISVRVM